MFSLAVARRHRYPFGEERRIGQETRTHTEAQTYQPRVIAREKATARAPHSIEREGWDQRGRREIQLEDSGLKNSEEKGGRRLGTMEPAAEVLSDKLQKDGCYVSFFNTFLALPLFPRRLRYSASLDTVVDETELSETQVRRLRTRVVDSTAEESSAGPLAQQVNPASEGRGRERKTEDAMCSAGQSRGKNIGRNRNEI